jgi:hypothetical protein
VFGLSPDIQAPDADVSTAYAPDLRDYSLTASGSLALGGELLVGATRQEGVVAFVIALSVVPLLLCLALALALYSRQETPTAVEILLGGSAVLFAILPIRVLLVPQDLGSLTLLDRIFGWEVGLLVTLIVWNVSGQFDGAG